MNAASSFNLATNMTGSHPPCYQLRVDTSHDMTWHPLYHASHMASSVLPLCRANVTCPASCGSCIALYNNSERSTSSNICIWIWICNKDQVHHDKASRGVTRHYIPSIRMCVASPYLVDSPYSPPHRYNVSTPWQPYVYIQSHSVLVHCRWYVLLPWVHHIRRSGGQGWMIQEQLMRGRDHRRTEHRHRMNEKSKRRIDASKWTWRHEQHIFTTRHHTPYIYISAAFASSVWFVVVVMDVLFSYQTMQPNLISKWHGWSCRCRCWWRYSSSSSSFRCVCTRWMQRFKSSLIANVAIVEHTK